MHLLLFTRNSLVNLVMNIMIQNSKLSRKIENHHSHAMIYIYILYTVLDMHTVEIILIYSICGMNEVTI